MSNSERVEQLAVAIAEDVYIDIAKWHLYLNDAHLHTSLAEIFYQKLPDGITSADVAKVLESKMIAIGGGKREIPLSDLIPKSCQDRLLTILEEFEY
ncbi:MAG: thylakoid-associated protein [Pseudanabaena sp.]|nr:MAG: thylakoid-associated protein [Pseudanabaena sp.]